MKNLVQLGGIHPSALLTSALQHGDGGTALHLGAGSGRDSLFLAANGYKVTAVDNTQSNLEVLSFAAGQAELPIGVLLADTSEFKPATHYDLVLASLTITFFDRELIANTVRMLQSITNPEGINVLLVSASKDAEDRPKLFETEIVKGLYGDWEVIAEEEQLAEELDDQRQYHRSGLAAKRVS